jgi:hypothetical protein
MRRRASPRPPLATGKPSTRPSRFRATSPGVSGVWSTSLGIWIAEPRLCLSLRRAPLSTAKTLITVQTLWGGARR